MCVRLIKTKQNAYNKIFDVFFKYFSVKKNNENLILHPLLKKISDTALPIYVEFYRNFFFL